MTSKEELQYVSQSIKQIRREKHISQMELSLKSNMSQSFLANVENGKKEPSALTLIRIAKALQIGTREFFPETKIESKENQHVTIPAEKVQRYNKYQELLNDLDRLPDDVQISITNMVHKISSAI